MTKEECIKEIIRFWATVWLLIVSPIGFIGLTLYLIFLSLIGEAKPKEVITEPFMTIKEYLEDFLVD